jgi:hypothetical protein
MVADSIVSLFKDGFIDSKTHALILTVTTYNLPAQIYTNINMLIEIS